MKVLNVNIYFILSIILFIVSLPICYLENYKLAIILSLLASITMLCNIRKILGNYSNLTFIFVLFSIVYGLCGPISTLFANGIADIFGNTYKYEEYMTAYSLAQIGILIGIHLCKFQKKNNNITTVRKKNNDVFVLENRYLLFISTIIMAIGSIFQIINTLRVGGISVLMLGKAIYQAKEASLSLTLPADLVILLAIACLSLYISGTIKNKEKINYKLLFVNLLLSTPYFLVIIFLGQRGELLYIILVTLIGLFYFNPIKKIGAKMAVIGVTLYLVLGFITANRSIIYLLEENPKEFFNLATDEERIVNALNPGTGEFGCTYGNFNFFIIKDDYELKLGQSYLRGFLMLIPSFIYPGEKPQQITYEFRDKYFSLEAERSAIASTGFSAILESFWNFGYIGIIITYIIYGYNLLKLDVYLSNKNLFSALFYTYISSLAIQFHRYAFGDIMVTIIIKLIIFITLVILPYIVLNKRKKI